MSLITPQRTTDPPQPLTPPVSTASLLYTPSPYIRKRATDLENGSFHRRHSLPPRSCSWLYPPPMGPLKEQQDHEAERRLIEKLNECTRDFREKMEDRKLQDHFGAIPLSSCVFDISRQRKPNTATDPSVYISNNSVQKRQAGFRKPTFPPRPDAAFDQKGSGRRTEEQSKEQRRYENIKDDTLRNLQTKEKSKKDTLRVLLKLKETFEDVGLYKQLLTCRKADAQMVLDVLQMLLDTHGLVGDLRQNIIGAMRRLSKKTELYPSCFNLQDPVRVLGDYTTDSGGYADIYKARLRRENICLKAVRTYKNSLLKQIVKVYAREAILWGQLSHQNILPFYGLYLFQSRIAVVSPWMENGQLRDYLLQSPHPNRVLLCSDTAAGLGYLHKHSIVHGDIKAANILVDGSGRACLADFGLSNVTDPQILHWTSDFPATSDAGSIRWQAPELILPDKRPAKFVRNSKASDVFAWACLCYEVMIFTGLLPFSECAREATVILKISRGDHPTKPADGSHPWTERGLTTRMWSIMEDCWKFQPRDRPHIFEVASQLALEVPLDTRPPSRWQARSAVEFRNKQRASSDYYQPTLEDLDAILV